MFINGTHSFLKTTAFVRTALIGACFTFLCANTAFAQESLLAGNPQAMDLFTEGKTYHDGDGVEADLEKALTLYTQAAALGNIDARINLAYMYFVGEGVEQNYSIARGYYLVAANAGDDVAQKNLGAMYEHGLGVEKNMKTAQVWYDKSEGKIAPAKPAKKINVPTTIAKTAPSKAPIAKIAQVQKTIQRPNPLKPQSNTIVDTQQIAYVPSTSPIAIDASLTGAPATVMASRPSLSKAANKISTPPPIQSTQFISTTTSLKRGSKWTSYVVGATLLFIALMGSFWYIMQLRTINRGRHQYNFASHFFAYHRESLRGSYLRTPENQRMFLYPRDPWAVSVCALMVRYAVQRNNDPHTKCTTSTHIVRALKKNPYAARLETFPLVGLVQERLFADIQHLNKETIHPPKPFQFKYTRFLSKTKGKTLGNTRPASLRLVK